MLHPCKRTLQCIVSMFKGLSFYNLFDGVGVPEVFLVSGEGGGGLVEDPGLEPRRGLLQQPEAGLGDHTGGHPSQVVISV